MAYIKKLYDEKMNDYEYHRISKIDLPSFKKNIGWGQIMITIVSYKNAQAITEGAEPSRIREYPVPFAVLPSIEWDSQEHLLAWAYRVSKDYLDDLTDAVNDNVGEPE